MTNHYRSAFMVYDDVTRTHVLFALYFYSSLAYEPT